MKPFVIALAAAASLAGATLVSAEASAAPGYSGGYGPVKPLGGPGGLKPGAIKPIGPAGMKPFKPGPGGIAVGPGKPGGGGVWKPPHKPGYGPGYWGGGYGSTVIYPGYAPARVAYFASPIYVGAYEACEWVKVRTQYGWRWRPYC